MGDIDGGFDRVHGLEVGHGFLDVKAGASTALGGFITGEAGYRAADNLDLFAFGRASTTRGAEAGVGLRMTF